MELYDLDRFLAAQDNVNTYETALQEVKRSWKQTHWIWYVFPQIKGLGHSVISKKYSLVSLLETKAYFENDTLRTRLYEITKALLEQDEDVLEVFGRTDFMKVLSCMTLFDIISPEDVFAEVIDRCYDGIKDEKTLEIVDKEYNAYQDDSAFMKNGVKKTPRAFMESGICESQELEEEQRIGTILDLLGRGVTMLELVEHYLWTKDFSYYRLSSVESTINGYLTNMIGKILEHTSDKDFIQNGIHVLDNLCNADTNAFTAAKVLDDFYKKYAENEEVKDVITTFVESSKCTPVFMINK